MPDTAAFDLDLYFSLPRVSGLALSPDGRRLVIGVQQAAPDGTRFIGALWALDPAGTKAPVRLTRSTKGEEFAAFASDGSILFTSTRLDNEPKADGEHGAQGDDEPKRLWLLPAAGGEPRVVASPANGVSWVHAARDADVVVYRAGRWPGVESEDGDAKRTKSRKEKAVEAQLFDQYPIRFWDHYLATARPRLFAGALSDDQLTEVRDLTPDAGPALDDQDEAGFDISADGALVVSTWFRNDGRGKLTADLAAIDVATGDRRLIARDVENDDWFTTPAISPDGTTVAVVRHITGTLDRALRTALWLIEVTTGEARELVSGTDHWPVHPVWTPDGSALLYTASENGLAPVFRVEARGERVGAVTRLTADGCYTDVCAAPDGSAIYALRSSYMSPPEAVAFDPSSPDQTPQPIPIPGIPVPVELPGRAESVTATASDGTPIQSWLLVPRHASPDAPAPLVVFIHGGPLGAWGEWHWRWNPQLLAERGYAVLLPNPALSTGFGQDFIQRGWGRWGKEPYTDVMAAVDSACSRPDIDDSRVAAMGGSFGGYMANWVAGQTDRFRCIVTHASLYALDGFFGTTDLGVWWEQEFGDPYTDVTRYHENSPNRFVANVRTPMLVIHGELDHRVPIAEALRLWTDLIRHGAEAKFLYFPDENHWIRKPNNARVWYEVVFAFLAEHVLDDPAAWKSEYLESLGIVP